MLKSEALDKAEDIISDLKPELFGIHKYLYFAVSSNLAQEKGERDQQKLLLWKALDCAPNDATRAILKERLIKADTQE